MVVESPAANGFAKGQHLGSPQGIGDAGEHAVGVGEMLGQHHRLFIARGRKPDEVVPAIHKADTFRYTGPCQTHSRFTCGSSWNIVPRR